MVHSIQPPRRPTPIPGVHHATLAGQAQGTTALSVWSQAIDIDGATPPHRHDCEEVVLCQAGTGELHIDGQVLRFGAGSTLTIARNVPHQIINIGQEPLQTMAVFAATPVRVYLPGGEELALPWPT